MADGTKIEWTDATWNVVNGCSVVSPGCTNCYAMRLAGTRLKHHKSRAGLTIDTKAGPVWTGETRFNEVVLLDPLEWKRPRRIFVCAHGDLFHDSVPDDVIDQVFAVMALAPQHQFQVLTKRPERMRSYFASIDNGPTRLAGDYWRDALIEGTAQKIWHDRTGDDTVDQWLAVHLPLPNVWLGVSIEDQARADERIPQLLASPAAVRWLSCEPLLGPVDLTNVCLVPKVPGSVRAGIHLDALAGQYCESGMPYVGMWDIRGPCPPAIDRRKIDWVVAGGESGPGARPMHPDWARSLRDQCASAGVPFLFKQWGEWFPAKHQDVVVDAKRVRAAHLWTEGHASLKVGKSYAGRHLDGQLHDGFPA